MWVGISPACWRPQGAEIVNAGAVEERAFAIADQTGGKVAGLSRGEIVADTRQASGSGRPVSVI